jgi:hypothetical protein
MASNHCIHTDRGLGGRVCSHLLQVNDADYCKRFTGEGRTYDLICYKCVNSVDTIDASLLHICEECFRELESDQSRLWEGVLGAPEISIRSSRLRFEHEDIQFIELGSVAPVAICPIQQSDDMWLACNETGALSELVPSQRRSRVVAQIPRDSLDFDGPMIQRPKQPKASPVVLKVSRGGELAAVANRYGDKGVVINLVSGKPTMSLRRDRYHQNVSCFPLDFVELGGRILVVHATTWNRLDVSDARTGALLTERGPTSYKRGEARPPHYLDYFHGSLSVSPGQQFIVDNGWVWTPVGIVVTWDIRRWLSENVWESEDGESRKRLCERWYYWDGPHCWLDDRELAVWGYGRDDEWLIPAVCVFDVRTGEQRRWFPGPNGSLTFDEYLFSFSDTDGTAVWDVATGERLLHDPSFCPLGYHPRSKTFLSICENGRARISKLLKD